MKARLLESLGALRPTIAEICSKTGAPSASIGVSVNGETIFQAGFGLRKTGEPHTPDSDTIYGIGSITKVFTASLISILVDEGSLAWSTPVREILKSLNTTDPFLTSEMTVVDLLSHRTALAVSTDWWTGCNAELLVPKNETIPFFNALKSVGSLRSRYDYNNWNYAILGEIIEELTGQSYGTVLNDRILKPLGMKRTSAVHIFGADDNFAAAHAVLDDLSSFQLPQPSTADGTIMCAAQGVQSTVNDLLKYGNALLASYSTELQKTPSALPLKNVATQFKAHTPRGPPSMFDASYCLGIHRHILPNTFAGLGCNSMFVSKMPTLTPGNDVRLVLQHGGSLAGYTTFFSLVPEFNASVAVLVNSIGLGDPASWIHQLILETIIETKKPNDYVALAEEAAVSHASSIANVLTDLQKARKDIPLQRPLSDFTGLYRDQNQNFVTLVRQNPESTEPQLQILFQARESQAWNLTHYQGDTFLLDADFNDLAKRAVFTFVDDAYYTFRFEPDSEGRIQRLYWAHDPVVAAEDQYFVKEDHGGSDATTKYGIQRPITKEQ